MRLARVSWAKLALLMGAVHFLLTVALGLSRHWGYLTSINDLGVFDQAIWGIVNGAPFLNTSNAFGLPINWLGFHFNPILLAFAPFYLIYPAAEWLVIFQAAAVSITAWPLYLLARKVLQSERAAFFWATAFLVNPFVLNAVAWDFHPVSLATPLMALGVLAVENRRGSLFLVICSALLLIQEHLGISVMGFGILWWLRNRTPGPALAAAGIGTAHFIFVLGVAMPALSPTGNHVMLSEGLGHLSRYGWLGTSAWGAIQNAVDQPLAIIKTIFVDMGGINYLALALLPFLGTPIAGLTMLTPGLADLLANLLSATPMQRSIFSYHTISLVPLLVTAGIYGSARLTRIEPRLFLPARNAAYVFVTSLVLGYFLAPLPLPFAANFWKPQVWTLEKEGTVSHIQKMLPPKATISAQANVAAHFSQRYRIYPFPGKVGEVDFIVLRLASPTTRLTSKAPGMVSLEHHLTIPPKQFLGEVEQLLQDANYGVAYWEPPWLIFSKGELTNEATARSVHRYLADLDRKWGPTKPVAP